MKIEVTIENIVPLLTPYEKVIIREIFAATVLSENNAAQTINFYEIAKKCGCSRSLMVYIIKFLNYLGIISSKSSGSRGTHIKICNAEACKRLFELCS